MAVATSRARVSTAKEQSDRQQYGQQYGGSGQGQYGQSSPYGPRSGQYGQSGMGQYGQSGMGQSGQGQMGRHFGRGPKGYMRSDDRIREDVNDRLTQDHELDDTEIEVKVKDGEVTLSGTVEDRNDKRRAEDCAEQVSGVKHVQNNIRVKPQSQSQNQSQSAMTAGNGGAAKMATSDDDETGAGKRKN
jgi:osmotically-inducible protein OsmY